MKSFMKVLTKAVFDNMTAEEKSQLLEGNINPNFLTEKEIDMDNVILDKRKVDVGVLSEELNGITLEGCLRFLDKTREKSHYPYIKSIIIEREADNDYPPLFKMTIGYLQ